MKLPIYKIIFVFSMVVAAVMLADGANSRFFPDTSIISQAEASSDKDKDKDKDDGKSKKKGKNK